MIYKLTDKSLDGIGVIYMLIDLVARWKTTGKKQLMTQAGLKQASNFVLGTAAANARMLII